MTSPTRQERRPPNGAGLLLLFAVLGGVFGMHALGSHGAVAHHQVAGTTHHDSASLSMVSGAGPTLMGPSSVRGTAGDQASAMSLCLAVLVGSILLLVRRGRGLRAVALAPRRLTTARPAAVRGRDRDPPSLALLSVRRC